jgi:hypothetical protein
MRKLATVMLGLLCLGFLASLASAAPNGTGSSASPGPSIQSPSNQAVIFHYVPAAAGGGECLDAFAAGCKLRHAPPAPPFASGSISVPGIVASGAVFAQLYWVVLADTPPPATEMLNGVPLVRIPIGPVTASPCWGEIYAFAYRADVLGIVVAGVNTLTGFPDTGVFSIGPESEGASLVVVHHTNGVDKEIIVTAGNDLLENIAGVPSAELPLPVVSPPGLGAELVFIGGDGQSAPDEVAWNGVSLAGTDAWLGIDPGPGVGYWDTMEFGVFVGPPNTASSFIPAGFWDCINWVGTVLKVKSHGCETVPVEPRRWGDVKNMYH